MLECLAEMLASPIPDEMAAAQQKTHIMYTMPSSLEVSHPDQLTVLESRALISSSGTTGLRTWEGALHLAHYLLSPSGRESIAGKNVLELGTGTGLVALMCATWLGAKRVMATDGDEGVVREMKNTFEASGLDIPGQVDAEVLRWGSMLTGSVFDGPNEWDCIDTVLGADIVSVTPRDHNELSMLIDPFLSDLRCVRDTIAGRYAPRHLRPTSLGGGPHFGNDSERGHL